MMKQVLLFGFVTVGLASCGALGPRGPAPIAPPDVEIVAPVEPTVVLPPPPGAKTAEALDTTTEAQRAAAVAAPVAGARELGKTTVALGSPTEPGFWIKTQLAAAPGKGRVVTEDGQSLNLDLIPGTGGALLSLAAFRQLGLGLTELPEVTVFAD